MRRRNTGHDRQRRRVVSRAFSTLFWLLVASAEAGAALPEGQETFDLESGRRLFLVYCAECHGEKGDGYGMRQDISYARPRSFQSARFKLSTTENGVPTDEDLFRTISRGMAGSGMPGWNQLSEVEIRSLVLFVRKLGTDALREHLDAEIAAGRLTPAVAEEVFVSRTVPGPPVEVPPEPQADAASLAQGRELYREACAACHGDDGSPPFGAVHVDFDGNRLPATSLRTGMFKGGGEGEQLYVRIREGMGGTAMPGYEDTYSPSDIWHVVHWVQELSRRGGDASPAAVVPTPAETTAAIVTAAATDARAAISEPPAESRRTRWLTLVAGIAAAGLALLLLALAIGSAR
ncbi:MAG TPA: c-type cytochrome [Thermoanaerobaculia bacterium]|nr:c-type cytochrome [Thermoanaerobaculia bacterium]